MVDFSPEQVRFLEFGRVVDTTRLGAEFGYVPRYSTAAAFDDFVRGRRLRPVLEPATVERVEQRVLECAGHGRPGGGGRPWVTPG